MKRNHFLLLLLVIVVAGGAYTWYIFNKPQRDVKDEKGIAVTAEQIFTEYNTNEQAANAKYLNKAIQVSGQVQNVKKNQEGKTVVYLKTSDPVFGVNCTFKEDPGNIEKNSQVSFKGICTGFTSDVVINQGILIK
ncbi:MAG: hypothetical protein JWN76_3714 [Chitinophagaceae bacterium]|nr:hypothetical protein [Chitinophagaceae bacterium]